MVCTSNYTSHCRETSIKVTIIIHKLILWTPLHATVLHIWNSVDFVSGAWPHLNPIAYKFPATDLVSTAFCLYSDHLSLSKWSTCMTKYFNCLLLFFRYAPLNIILKQVEQAGFDIGSVISHCYETLTHPKVFFDKEGIFKQEWRNYDR